MRKTIAILGSTGSIGKTLLEILTKEKKNIDIKLLSSNKNYQKLLKQAKIFNVKNLIILDKSSYKKLKKNKNLRHLNIYNNFKSFKKIFNNQKIDYTMNAITGIDGLKPTLDIIRWTKKIAIANKEAIICGWDLIRKKLERNKTLFVPVDSEHFSIWYAIKNNKINNIQNLIITASGGPLLNVPISKLKTINKKIVLNHPNWKMGKKITVDSATMMNKVFEVIEAKNIFNLDLKKISIIIDPSSFIHSIIKFNDGMIKIIAHETTMKIPIFNTFYSDHDKKFSSGKIKIVKLNNLNFQTVNLNKYPHVKVIKRLPTKSSLFETVIVSVNDELVRLYLENKIKYKDISKYFFKFILNKKFQKYKNIKADKIEKILSLNKYVRLKINTISI